MNITEAIGDSRKYTLHSHTEFCDGRATMEAFAREASVRGFEHYGFTPHSPVPIVSPCNMLERNVPKYFEEFQRICDTHGDKLRFYLGMEIDYLGDDWNASNDYFQKLNLDYSISSVHFIPTQDGELIDIDGRFERFRRKMSENFRNDIRYVVEKFYEQSIRMVESGGFDIIGHFDKIGHNADHFQPGIEEEYWYQALVDDLIEVILSSGVIVEINTKALADHKRFFPQPRVWQRLIDGKARLVVNSDAHVPALIDAGREEAYKLLDKLKKE